MYKKILPFIAMSLIFVSCGNEEKKAAETMTHHDHDTMAVIKEANYKDLVFDSPKDLVCGMPTSAGVSDTAQHSGKVYGFCSKECKDEFIKNPSAFIAVK